MRIEVVFDVTLDINNVILADVVAIVMSAATAGLELIFEGANAMEVSVGVRAGSIIGGVRRMGAEVNAGCFTALANALEFASAPPLEEPFLCC